MQYRPNLRVPVSATIPGCYVLHRVYDVISTCMSLYLHDDCAVALLRSFYILLESK